MATTAHFAPRGSPIVSSPHNAATSSTHAPKGGSITVLLVRIVRATGNRRASGSKMRGGCHCKCTFCGIFAAFGGIVGASERKFGAL